MRMTKGRGQLSVILKIDRFRRVLLSSPVTKRDEREQYRSRPNRKGRSRCNRGGGRERAGGGCELAAQPSGNSPGSGCPERDAAGNAVLRKVQPFDGLRMAFRAGEPPRDLTEGHVTAIKRPARSGASKARRPARQASKVVPRGTKPRPALGRGVFVYLGVALRNCATRERHPSP